MSVRQSAKWFGLLFLLVQTLGCGASVPDKPPPMDVEAERARVEKNIQLETEYINSNPKYTEEEKKKYIEQVHRTYEGYMKAFIQSKLARDDQYGTD